MEIATNNEERHIEVKRRSDNIAEIIITKKEYEFAKSNPDKCWLYIVIDAHRNPKILTIENSLPFLEEFCETRYSFKPT